MDIAGVATGLSQAKLMNQVGIAMLSKSLDTSDDLGAGLVNMIDAAAMELSVNPSIGSNIDIRI